MGTVKSIDVRIASFFERIIKYYISKRVYGPTPEDLKWSSLFTENDNFIYKLDDETKIKLFRDSVLCRLIYFGFEQNELNFIKKFLKQGDIFFDIGANIGLYSLIASKLVTEKGSIFAFEPTPKTYDRLCQNIELNSIKNILANQFGLSNKKGFQEYNISTNGYDAWNSFAKLPQLENCETIKVEIQTLDTFIEEKQIPDINLIKIDVEGWEKFVLEGAKKLLTKEDAPVFLIEFTETNAFEAGYYCGELFDFMKSFGFEWYSYDSITNKLNKEVKKLHYPYENLIAIKNFNDCYDRINNA